jgi:PIN domain nuclease of toxin-antitoxin system
MNLYVADTHALFWYLTASSRLSDAARAAFDEGVRGEALIYVPAIVLAELYYLNQKFGQPLDFSEEYVLLEQSGQFVMASLAPSDVLSFDQDSAVPEMHDRIIVGLARRLSAKCISRDPLIVNSDLVPVVW